MSAPSEPIRSSGQTLSVSAHSGKSSRLGRCLRLLASARRSGPACPAGRPASVLGAAGVGRDERRIFVVGLSVWQALRSPASYHAAGMGSCDSDSRPPRAGDEHTPTYSSWLNQAENWFARIQRDVITCGVFTSTKDLDKKLKRWIRQYNKLAAPLKWKYSDPTRRIRCESSGSAD